MPRDDPAGTTPKPRSLVWSLLYVFSFLPRIIVAQTKSSITRAYTYLFAHLPAPVESFADENNRLEAILTGPNQLQTLFVALCLKRKNVVSEIGFSVWCPGLGDEITSHSWIVSESSSVARPATEARFLYGKSEVIAPSQIQPFIDATFSSFRRRYDTIHIVGHSARSTEDTIKKLLNQDDFAFGFDTQRIWQYQHREQQEVSLEKILLAMKIPHQPASLENAGNASHYIILLLQKLGNAA